MGYCPCEFESRLRHQPKKRALLGPFFLEFRVPSSGFREKPSEPITAFSDLARRELDHQVNSEPALRSSKERRWESRLRHQPIKNAPSGAFFIGVPGSEFRVPRKSQFLKPLTQRDENLTDRSAKQTGPCLFGVPSSGFDLSKHTNHLHIQATEIHALFPQVNF